MATVTKEDRQKAFDILSDAAKAGGSVSLTSAGSAIAQAIADAREAAQADWRGDESATSQHASVTVAKLRGLISKLAKWSDSLHKGHEYSAEVAVDVCCADIEKLCDEAEKGGAK